MARINSRAKGASGEREFCEWLQKNFDLPVKPKRNLEQVRSGGLDVIFPPFGFEVKREENIRLMDYWTQVKRAVEAYEKEEFVKLEPVVAFRQNKQPWEFLICASHIDLKRGFVRLTERAFINWVNMIVENKPPFFHGNLSDFRSFPKKLSQQEVLEEFSKSGS